MLRAALVRVAIGAALVSAAGGAASDGSFQVNPVRVTLSASQPVSALTVRNNGLEAAVVQLEVVDWTQQDGKDVYSASREVLATPPIFTVKPGASQVVRVGLRRPPDEQRELSYRLFLQEVPQPSLPRAPGLQIALRIGVPIFVLPAEPTMPVLVWRASRTAQGQIKLTAANQGIAHVQVTQFAVSLPGATQPVQQVGAYVLVGQSRDWLVAGEPPPGSALHLTVQTDAGDLQVDVIVENAISTRRN